MREVEALISWQKDLRLLTFVDDPRKIIPLVRISDISKGPEEYNRPYDPKRVAEIKRYVAGKEKMAKEGKEEKKAKGFIPNSPTLNFTGKIKIKEVDSKHVNIEFPDIPSEMSKFKDSIEVLDGQHRLLAFEDPDPDLKDNEKYYMTFVAFEKLSIDEKKEIFMVLNDKQKAVERNILLRHKRLLHLLLEPDETRYELIMKLAKEDYSPFKEKIIIAGEKIIRGIKLIQLDGMLKKSGLVEQYLIEDDDIPNKAVKGLCDYYAAWKRLYEDKWFTPGSTLTKAAGVRFMTYLAPSVLAVVQHKKTKGSVDVFQDIIKHLTPYLYDWDMDKAGDAFKYAFRGETSTIELARKLGKKLIERLTPDAHSIW